MAEDGEYAFAPERWVILLWDHYYRDWAVRIEMDGRTEDEFREFHRQLVRSGSRCRLIHTGDWKRMFDIEDWVMKQQLPPDI